MIISFSQLGKHGRLGNQLFQIAATFGLAQKFGARPVFPTWKYAEYFENYLPAGDFPRKRVVEEHFHYQELEIKESCDLFGYFQSPRYFRDEMPRLKPGFVRDMRNRLDIWDKTTICLQIRRGDYVGNPNYVQLPITYYLWALEVHFPGWRNCNILVISDDIEYCRVHLECLPNVTFSTGLSDIQDMALAANCDHFIISNSTFGWWTAWFGWKRSSLRAKVVYPEKMFAGKLAANNTADYWPSSWRYFPIGNLQLKLQDVTFTIPVFHDHPDRKRNLDLSLCLLQKDIRAHYIVCEQGGDKFTYVEKYAQYMRFESNVFHRTRMLNEMARAAKTPYIVNWDCDVFIPPIQLWCAVELLRSGVDMVYPFDGRFARMQRVEWFPRLQKALDIGVVGNTRFKGRENGHMSAGGAVFFNKQSFIEGGLENQNMISFGPEDWERYHRFQTLGYKIVRVGGALFHMSHYVGPNSSSLNPHFRANHEIFEKLRKMTVPELREHISAWEWRKEAV